MNTPEKTVPSRTYRIAVLPGDGIGKLLYSNQYL